MFEFVGLVLTWVKCWNPALRWASSIKPFSELLASFDLFSHHNVQSYFPSFQITSKNILLNRMTEENSRLSGSVLVCLVFTMYTVISSPEPKAHLWAYRIGRPPLSVCLLSTLLNILSSETSGPIEARFRMESPWDGIMKICSNGPGHMTKMAVMPIYGKKFKKVVFSGTKRPMTLKLHM